MMGASDVCTRPSSAGQRRSEDAPVAADISRLNDEWRERRQAFHDGGSVQHLAPIVDGVSRMQSRSTDETHMVSDSMPVPRVSRDSVPSPSLGTTQSAGSVALNESAVDASNHCTGVDGGLTAAAASGDVDSCRRILERGLTGSCAYGPDGTTPLAAAALWGQTEVLRLLLSCAADPSQPNRKNSATPLHCAALQEHGKVCMLLLEARADPRSLDNRGAAPCDFAACSEAVWPLFAAAGCERPTKEDLVARGVIRRASPALEMELGREEGEHGVSGVVPEFSRPGSAYVVSALHPPRPGSAMPLGLRPASSSRPSSRLSCSRPIDILAEDSGSGTFPAGGTSRISGQRPVSGGLQGLGL